MKKKFYNFIAVFIIVATITIPLKSVKAMGPVTEVGPNMFTNVLNTAEAVWNTGVVKMLEPAIESLANKLLDKVIDSSLNWAFGGFDGEPSFVNNFGEFIKGTKYDEIINWYDESAKGVIDAAWSGQSQACVQELADLALTASTYWDTLDQATKDQYGSLENYKLEWVDDMISSGCAGGNNTPSTPGDAAQTNYENQKKDKTKLKRAATKAIAIYGREKLKDSDIEETIGLKNETMSKVLGEDGSQKFNNDFKEGGWGAYLELLNPSNTEIGIASAVVGELDIEVSKETEEVITNLQSPVKFLDKTECVEWEKEVNKTTGKRECKIKKTLTPGDQVAAKINNALTKDEDMAENADGLIGTLLKSAVGKLTKGIIDKGLAKINSNVTNSFYDASKDIFSKEYDGTSLYSESNDPQTPSDDGENYVGGPEDAKDYGQGGPQIIIDFEKDFEKKLALTREEKGYFDQIKLTKKENQGVVIALDQCVPGPDYGWEERFDKLETKKKKKDEEDEGHATNAIALAETSEMAHDSKVNIPGALNIIETIKLIINTENGETVRNQQRIQALSKVMSTLNYIHDEVLSDFNAEKQDDNQNLVIFSEDWNNLTQAQKENALQYAIDHQYVPLLNGETANSILVNDSEKAKQAVLHTAWQLWTEETPHQKKTELRIAYFNNDNDLPSNESISLVKAETSRTEAEAIRSQQLLRDCSVFKAFAFGMNPDQIQSMLNANANTLEQISSNNISFNKEFAISYTAALFPGMPSEDPIFLPMDDAKTDAQIKAFLINEQQKQQNNQQSLFLTSTITGNIDNSILGFPNEAAKNQYFSTIYGDAHLKYVYTKNAKNIRQIYKQDRYIYRGRIRGSLFCRHPGQMVDWIGWSRDKESVCADAWYITSGLQYRASFAGI